MAKNYYEILGVPRTASDDDIKRAFRQKARELHPDVNASDDATARFQQVNEAYQVLSDPDRRARFDRTIRSPRVRVKTQTPAPERPTPPPARPASTYPRPEWSPPRYTPKPQQRYRYSWQRPAQVPAWIPRFAELARHFVGSGFFWAFVVIQLVSIIALPTGAPVLGATGWTILWLSSFALPVVAIVIGIRKTAE